MGANKNELDFLTEDSSKEKVETEANRQINIEPHPNQEKQKAAREKPAPPPDSEREPWKFKNLFKREGRPRKDGQKMNYPPDMFKPGLDAISSWLDRNLANDTGAPAGFTDPEKKALLETGVPVLNKYMEIGGKSIEINFAITAIFILLPRFPALFKMAMNPLKKRKDRKGKTEPAPDIAPKNNTQNA